MELDDPPGDRQSETRAALLARGGVIDLLKLLEDPLLVGLGDAGSRVRHRDDELTVGAARLQPHLARLGELDRVADEVQQNLGEAPIVAPAARQVGGEP